MPALKKEDITKIHHAYKEVLKNCNRMLTILDNQLKRVSVITFLSNDIKYTFYFLLFLHTDIHQSIPQTHVFRIDWRANT